MFSSVHQLQQFKPTMLCDVLSLFYVAFYFIENGLPWTDFIDLQMEQNPNQNLYVLKTFKQIRLDQDTNF